ncbi:phospholipid carrier-dependent glycosyltransferase [uncultured Oxalicibacterium sp.]|uniref:ArnT family glycosyltransferase n=1 Tax=uncultured Oxalicibacterium sp. TaxID=1168540 RepID=UPI0025F01E3A|nr:phospholipid carrier-dependent glycosyltransferase [uncultured Oxalicibacterium sp.]
MKLHPALNDTLRGHDIRTAAPAPFASRKVFLGMLAASAILLLAYRIVLMWLLPLADTTEARYGEIARLTVTHGFWLMPHIDATTPFFAKPPLSTWASAGAMALFGINEFAARLPALLATLIAVRTAMAFAAAYHIRKTWLVIPILASCPLFFISAGAVMTDAIQMSVVMAALYCAWRAIAPLAEGESAERRTRRHWRIGFWVMVGIGALCKGLADWALIGMPLIAYALVERRPLALLRQLMDGTGIALCIALFLPWYLAAEHAYPGFLNYFIVGEHFSRFLVPGWKGDRYGIAHMQPLGTIWLFWSAAILPWLGVFLMQLWQLLRKRADAVEPLERFLWCATLMPLLFFTFAHNIIWTYGLTSIVPFAVLAARWLENASSAGTRIAGGGILALTIAAAGCYQLIQTNVSGNSDRDLVRAFHQIEDNDIPLAYRIKPAYSAHFYTRDNLLDESDAGRHLPADVAPFAVERNELIGNAPVYFHGTRYSLIKPH